MKKLKRSGDVNLYPITGKEYKKIKGTTIKHNGSYVLAEGEATGSKHLLQVKDPANMEIEKDGLGKIYIAIKNEQALATHTHDHETIEIPAHTYWIRIPEREVDHFADSVVRQVVD